MTTDVRPDLLSRDFTNDPYALYRRMRQEGAAHKTVVKTLTVELNAWVVTRYDEARALLADARLSKDAGGLPGVVDANKVQSAPVQLANFQSMLFSDPPDHTRLRRILGGVFTMRRVELLRPWIQKATGALLDRVVPGEPFDVVAGLANPLPIGVIGALLGVPEDRHDDFRAWNATLTGVEAPMAEKMRAHGAATAYLRELIAAKRAEPGEDLISGLVRPVGGGDAPLDEGELLSTIFLVMNAGYETTASMIGNSVQTLLAEPGLLAALRADPAAVPAAVEEFLRYESPLNLATVRYTLEPVRVGDVLIPAGDIVFVSLAAANRDPERFADPDRPDLSRGDTGHLAFGHGIHHCIGAPLARIEGETALRALLERFPTWRLDIPAEELRWRNSMQFRALERLPVVFS